MEPEKTEIIIQAAKEFPSPSGNIIWKEAFTKHPEWKQKLLPSDLDEKKAITRLYPITSQMRDRGLFGEEMRARSNDKKTLGGPRVAWNKGVKTGPKNRAVVVYRNGAAVPAPVNAACEFNFCPGCGRNVGGMIDGANLLNYANQHGISLQKLRTAIDTMAKAGL